MDVKTVCLGMLTSGDASGYDLKKCFESSFGHFFAAGYGSIYPALSSLAESGLVTCENVPQDGKPDRKVYSITEEGRKELMRSLENQTPGHKVRSEFLAQICFAHLMTDDQIDAVIDHRLGEIQKLLKVFEEFDECDLAEVPKGAEFVAGFGRAVACACRDYIENNRQMLVDSESPELKSVAG